MKESHFIDQNKKKWKEFEQLLASKNKDPERLNELFIQVTDDLSYARTFYKNRSVRVYLNRLAQRVFHIIYKRNRFTKKRFVHYWKEEVPQIMWESRRAMLISFAVFALSFAIGWLSSAFDPSFVRLILGDGYVNMTIENIKSGDPMKVYKEMNEMDMSFGIALNNLRVSFLTFAMGIFLGLGTIYIIIYNGVMVGTFQHFFYEKGLFWDSFLTIWVHGTLEISCIVIAGGAGLLLGRGLVFPGTYNRLQSFQKAGKLAIKIMFAISPIIVTAAIVEGFLTRYTDVPDVVRASIIVVSLVFILGYFVVYPRLKAREGFKKPIQPPQLNPDRSLVFDYNRLYSVGDIFAQGFMALKKWFKPLFYGALVVSVPYSVIYGFMYVGAEAPEPMVDASNTWVLMMFQFFGDIIKLFDYTTFPLLALMNLVAFSVVMSLLMMLASNDRKKPTDTVIWSAGLLRRFLARQGYKVVFFTALFLGFGALHRIVAVNEFVSFLFGLVYFLMWSPFLALSMYISVTEKLNPFAALQTGLKTLFSGFWKIVGTQTLTTILSMMILFINSSMVLWLLFELITWSIEYQEDIANQLVVSFYAFISLFSLLIIGCIWPVSAVFLYHSQKEELTASKLKKDISGIGTHKTSFGIRIE